MKFGALPFIYGTVVTSVLALLISVPLGVGAAIFLAELAPAEAFQRADVSGRTAGRGAQRHLGLLAIFTLVPLMRQYIEPFLKHTLGFLPLFTGPVYGVGYLTAGVILAIMTFPFIISISREALLAVPREQREAAWRWAPPSGNPPGRWWCPSRGWASSDRFSWRWPAPWAKPWRSPW